MNGPLKERRHELPLHAKQNQGLHRHCTEGSPHMRPRTGRSGCKNVCHPDSVEASRTPRGPCGWHLGRHDQRWEPGIPERTVETHQGTETETPSTKTKETHQGGETESPRSKSTNTKGTQNGSHAAVADHADPGVHPVPGAGDDDRTTGRSHRHTPESATEELRSTLRSMAPDVLTHEAVFEQHRL